MNIFKEIAQNEHFVPEYQNEIENLLIKLIEQLNQIKPNSFYDSLMEVFSVTIKKSKGLSAQGILLIGHLKAIFEAKKQKIDDLFEFMNLSLIYGSEVFRHDLQKLEIIIQIAVEVLTNN